MKVIFLDIDGVLNSNQWRNPQNPKAPREGHIDASMEGLLAEIVNRTGAALVLHSGWRLCFDSHLLPTCDEMVRFLQILEQFNLKLTDMTPDFTTGEIRKSKQFSLVKAREIEAWLQNHPKVTRYIVLDDIALPGILNSAVLVQTDPSAGLSAPDVEKAVNLLNRV